MEHVIHGKQTILQKVLRTFFLSLIVATVGLYIGQYVPPALMLPLIIVEIGMLIASAFMRKKKMIGYPFLFIFVFISGVTLFPTVYYYASTVGAYVVLEAFLATTLIFGVMSLVGYKTKRDLGFMSSFLLVALLAIIGVSLFSLFMPLTSTALFALSCIGSIVFSLYILYDFNRMKQGNLTEEMIPLLALNLYLDFINLFLNLLRMLGFISKD